MFLFISLFHRFILKRGQSELSRNGTWQSSLCQTHHVLIATLEFADNCYQQFKGS